MNKIDVYYRAKLNSIGIIELSIYGDTCFIYLMKPQEEIGHDSKCLCSIEFSDLDLNSKIKLLYDAAIEKGLFDG